MKYLARLILSIESLIKNPMKWFDKQPWFFRILLTLLLFPTISAISILGYQYFYQMDLMAKNPGVSTNPAEIEELKTTLENYHNSQIEEMIYLREEVSELRKALELETDPDKEVLGVTDPEDEENLQDRLKEFKPEDLENPDNKSVYVKADTEGVVMYKLPSTTSEKITDFDVGTFYPALEKRGDWQEIDFGNGSTAWIETKYIILFPIDENN